MDFLKRLDAYPKTMEDFRVRTKAGALVSVLSALFITFLVYSELSLYLTTDVQAELFVDTTRGEKLLINFDVVFPQLPCSYVSVDVMDVSGEHQFDVAHDIIKKRLNKHGDVISESQEKQNELGRTKAKPTEGALTKKEECGSCYGAESYTGQCCNTCEEVQNAYRQRGWAFSDHTTISQCIDEGFSEKLEAQKGEGCQLFGHLFVNKVAGNFHFAPGKSFQQSNVHVHDLHPYKNPDFNLRHKINRLSFGKEFPGVINPLDGVFKGNETTGSASFQYFIKIVPTIYESLNSPTLNTNQFSVTEHFRLVPPNQTSHGLPGVFFMYDLSPIMIKYSEKRRSFGHFLTGICAIIGGVFTVAGIIDSFIYHSIRSIEKKVQLGKHS